MLSFLNKGCIQGAVQCNFTALQDGCYTSKLKNPQFCDGKKLGSLFSFLGACPLFPVLTVGSASTFSTHNYSKASIAHMENPMHVNTADRLQNHLLLFCCHLGICTNVLTSRSVNNSCHCLTTDSHSRTGYYFPCFLLVDCIPETYVLHRTKPLFQRPFLIPVGS